MVHVYPNNNNMYYVPLNQKQNFSYRYERMCRVNKVYNLQDVYYVSLSKRVIKIRSILSYEQNAHKYAKTCFFENIVIIIFVI